MAVLNLGLASLTTADSITAAGNVIRLVNDVASPGASMYYGTDSGGSRGWFSLTTEGVNSITGTAGQVLANGTSGSAQTGSVTLTLATALTSINSVTSVAGQNLVLALGTGGTALTLTSSTLAATFAGDITVNGGDITGSNANAVLTLDAGGAALKWGSNSRVLVAGPTLVYNDLGTVTARFGTNGGLYVGGNVQPSASAVEIGYTTTSTSTSTGALVVGNGSSGGLGVGGAGFFGGTLSSGPVAGFATVPNGAGTGVLPQAQFSATSATAAISVYVQDGTNNRRAALFVDQTNAIWGLSHSFSSGVLPFIVYANGELLRLAGATGAMTLGSASSITAASATALTLAGGSSGATAVLGQSTDAGFTFTSKGTGAALFTNASSNAPLVAQRDNSSTSVAAASTVLAIRNENTTTNNNAAIAFQSNDGAGVRNGAQIAGVFTARTSGTNITGELVFSTANATAAVSEKMRLSAVGNLLIGGTTDPTGGPGQIYQTVTGGSIRTQIPATGYIQHRVLTSGTGAAQYVTEYGSVTASFSTYADTNTTFGVTRTDYSALLHSGGNGLLIGTIESDPVIIGTNNAARVTIAGADGAMTLGSASSITAASATNLTLAGGSSGASLVLGQGTAANATITTASAGSGVFQVSDGAAASARRVRASFNSSTAPYTRLDIYSNTGSLGGYNAALRFLQNADITTPGAQISAGWISSTDDYFLAFHTTTDAGATLPEAMRVTPERNLLIGTTTDISGSGNLAVAGGTVTAGAAATSLTLAGGNSGATEVLGHGTNGGLTFTSKGTGTATFVNAAGAAPLIAQRDSTSTSLAGANTTLQLLNNDTTTNNTTALSFQTYEGAFVRNGAQVAAQFTARVPGFLTADLVFLTANGSSTVSEKVRLTAPGNLLIGGTTDITGSGGLKVFGTTAATSTTSGALQVAGGAGVAGAIYAGGAIVSAGSNTIVLDSANGLTSIRSATSGPWDLQHRFLGSTAGANLGVFGGFGGTDSLTYLYLGTSNSVTFLRASSTQVSVQATTASSSTTTGALTVAGGVGVAGALYSNQLFVTGGGSNNAGTISSVSASDVRLGLNSVSRNWNFMVGGSSPTGYAPASGVFGIADATAGAVRLSIDTSGNTGLSGDLTVSGGSVGVGGAVDSSIGVYLRGSSTLTGTSQYGFVANQTFSSAATAAGYGTWLRVLTAASSYTMTNGYGAYVEIPLIGAGSAITTLTGLHIANQGASGVTNAYGIDIAAQSGAASVNIGLRNAGLTSLTNTTEATTAGAGSLTTAGGIYAAKRIVSATEIINLGGQGWGVASVSTAGGTTTLTSASPTVQIFTGSTTQTVQLPAANTLGAGVAVVYVIKNRSTGTLTVQRAGSDTIEGAVTVAVPSSASITIVSNGVSEWELI